MHPRRTIAPLLLSAPLKQPGTARLGAKLLIKVKAVAAIISKPVDLNVKIANEVF